MIKKWLLRGLIASASLLLLLLGFIWLGLPYLIKSQAPAFLQDKSGHTLSLDKPSINPLALKVVLANASLKSPDNEELVKLDSLDIDLSWAALVKGEVQIDHFLTSGLAVSYALLPQNSNNWQKLIDSFAQPAPDTPEEEKPASNPALTLARFALTNGQVRFEDRRTPTGYKTVVSPINVELNDLSTIAGRNGQFELNAKTGYGEVVALTASIDPVAMSLNGKLSVSGVALVNYQQILTEALPYRQPKGQIQLGADFSAGLMADSLQYKVTNGQVNIQNVGLKSGDAESASQASLDKLTVDDIEYSSDDQTAKLAGLGLQGLKLLTNGGTQKPVELASLAIGPVEVDLNKQTASVASVVIAGIAAEIVRLEDGSFELEKEAAKWTPPAGQQAMDTPAEPTEKEGQNSPIEAVNQQSAPTPAWTYSLNKVEIQGSKLRYADASFKPALDYTVKLERATATGVSQNLEKPLPLAVKLDLQGGGTLDAQGSLTPATVNGEFDLLLSDLAVSHAQPFITPFARLEVVSGAVRAQGKLALADGQVTYQGTAGLDQLRLNEQGTSDAFFALGQLSLADINGGTAGLDVRQINIRGLDTRLAIAKDKSTNIDKILVPQPEAAKQVASEEEGSEGNAYPFSIGKVVVADSKLDFEDLSLILPFGTKIQKLNATVSGLSSKPGTRGQVYLSGTVNKDGNAKGEGTVNFLDPTDYLDLDLKFKNVDMAQLTPYTATFASRKIDGGRLSLNLNYSIRQKALVSSNQVIVEKLKLGEKVKSPDAVDLPLELAVALLEDSNGVIDLGLPVKGSLDDPGFEIGPLVMKTLVNLITKAVAAPFKLLGGLLGGDSGEAGLKEVGFAAGDSGLSDADQTRIKQMATALNQRPALKLQVQGYWTEGDRVALKDRITRLKVYRQMGVQIDELNPPELDFDSSAVKAGLQKVFIEERGEERFRSVREAYRDVNPGGLDEGLFDKALAGMSGFVDPAPKLGAEEKQLLKGRSFETVLYEELNTQQPVSDNLVEGLAKSRARAVVNQLESLGVDSSRVTVNPAAKAEAAEGQSVPVGLELGA